MRPIDADGLYKVIKNSWDTSDAEDFEKSVFVALATAPTIEERKKGKWTQILNADMVTHDYRCSECHRFRFHNGEMRKKYNYCPNCGARMEGE